MKKFQDWLVEKEQDPNFQKWVKDTRDEAIVEVNELNDIRSQLKQMLPNWADYPFDDMIMAGFKNPNSGWKIVEDAQRWLTTEFPRYYGKQANQVRWQQMPVNIRMDIFDDETIRNGQLPERVQGAAHQGPSNKNDADRTAYASKSLQGKTSFDEPIILANMDGKYRLIEGWHRVIELLKTFPQGTMQQAWVMQ